MVIGTLVGLAAGFIGGVVDLVVSVRMTEVVLSIPTLLLVIVVVSVIGPSLSSVIAVIGLLGWPGTARIVRGQLLSLREAEYVTAVRVVGVRDRNVIFGHLLPNVFEPVDRGRDIRSRERDPARGGAELPRARRAAPNAEPRSNDQRCAVANGLARPVVGLGSAWARDRTDGARRELRRRLAFATL